MIRTTFIGAVLVVGALAAGAQTPPPPPPPPMEPFGAMELEPMLPMEPFGVEPMIYFDATPALEELLPLESWHLLDATPALEELLPLESWQSFDALPAIAPTPPFVWFDGVEPLIPLEPGEPLLPMIAMGECCFAPATPAVPAVPAVPAFPDVPATPAVPHAPASWHVLGQSHLDQQLGDITSEPPQAWAQSDPADSLYRLARQTLNRGEYRRASQLFGDIGQRFPSSVYAGDARYWKAFALYRIGGANDLRDALAALESNGTRFRQASLHADAATLASRIRGALAQLGDVRQLTNVERTAGQQGVPCDKEDAAVRTAALNALGDVDRESSTPIFKRILAKRDGCSASLRRNALFLVAKRGDPEATSIIISSARNDTDPFVRAEALRWLARMPGDEALATLEEIVRTPGNESLRQSAISALSRSDSPRARQAIRNIIERSDVSESLRSTALASVASEQTPDGGAYIRNVYPRLETPRLKLGAVRAIARIGGADNERWLLGLIRNQNEPLDVRSTALTYAGRSGIPIGDLVSMYDAAGDRPLRFRLISLYGSRSEPQASDKLITIAKTGTDPEARRMAISALSRKNDPRTRQLLLEILDK